MIGQGDVAIFAGGHALASVAYHPHGVAPPVLEEDDLLFLVQGLPYLLNQEVGKYALRLPLTGGGSHIHHPDVGQLVAREALGELHQPILAQLHIVVAFQRRSGGAQQHGGLVHPGQHYGAVAGVVARGRVLLLVGGVVLLIYNDEPEVLVGQQQG